MVYAAGGERRGAEERGRQTGGRRRKRRKRRVKKREKYSKKILWVGRKVRWKKEEPSRVSER